MASWLLGSANLAFVAPAGSVFSATLVEILFTFFLVAFVMSLKGMNLSGTKDGVIANAAFCFLLYCLGTMAGRVSGGCLNPFVCTTQSIYNMSLTGTNTYKYFATFLFAPYLGGILAGFFGLYL